MKLSWRIFYILPGLPAKREGETGRKKPFANQNLMKFKGLESRCWANTVSSPTEAGHLSHTLSTTTAPRGAQRRAELVRKELGLALGNMCIAYSLHFQHWKWLWKEKKKSYNYNMWTTEERRKVSNVLGMVPSSFMILSSKVTTCHMQTCLAECGLKQCSLEASHSSISFSASIIIINEERLSLVAGWS